MSAILLLISILSLSISCTTVNIKRELKSVGVISSINPDLKFLKAHMKDGTVFVLHSWQFDNQAQMVLGYGHHLDINRKLLEARGSLKSKAKASGEKFSIPVSGVALVETNDPGPSLVGGLAFVTGISVGLTLYCSANPKACFGSCPTFYALKGDTIAIQAEGFSTSIAPSLERTDIDMLYNAVPTNDFELIVSNEAMETHSIRHANLLAFEKEEGHRVFATPQGRFYNCSDLRAPLLAKVAGQNITDQVKAADFEEYFSLADQDDLNSKEEILLTFGNENIQELGLVIGKRQTLLTTFLMYQGLAYMGNSVTYWMGELERGVIEKQQGIFDLLGGIEVYSKDAGGRWIFEGNVNETGPIATDYCIIPLSHFKGDVKLRLNKGLWRVNYLALANLNQEVQPDVIKPSNVEVIYGSEEDPYRAVTDEDKFLVTYPGDKYRISYILPATNVELFLDSRGYYLEWIRKEWIEEQNLKKFRQMIKHPDKYLRNAAHEYKKLEPTMEEAFWKSRYVSY